MNKYLLMSAAAALATTAAGTAQAGSYSVHYGTASGGSYCDGLIGASTASYGAGDHIYTHCSGYTANLSNIGLVTKVLVPKKKKKGGSIVFSDTTFAYFDHIASESILFDVQSPIKTGGNWDLWIGFGDSGFLGNEGKLLSGQYAKVNPGKKVDTSSAKVLAALRAK